MPEQFCRRWKSWPCPFIRWGIWNDPHYPDTQNKLCLQWRLFPRPSSSNQRREGTMRRWPRAAMGQPVGQSSPVAERTRHGPTWAKRGEEALVTAASERLARRFDER